MHCFVYTSSVIFRKIVTKSMEHVIDGPDRFMGQFTAFSPDKI
jgi:hypothetical protein